MFKSMYSSAQTEYMIDTNNVDRNSAEIRCGYRVPTHQNDLFVFVFYRFSTSWLQKEL